MTIIKGAITKEATNKKLITYPMNSKNVLAFKGLTNVTWNWAKAIGLKDNPDKSSKYIFDSFFIL